MTLELLQQFSDRLLSEAYQSTGKSRGVPEVEAFLSLVAIAYAATMKTEEGQPITFHLVYLNPDTVSTSASIPYDDKWSFTPFAAPIPYAQRSLVKLAKATDPRSSAMVIFQDERKQWNIWGLIDQQHVYFDHTNHIHRDFPAKSPEVPGVFHIVGLGIGHIEGLVDGHSVVTLNVNNLRWGMLDVLGGGPVNKALSGLSIEPYIEEVKAAAPHLPWDDQLHPIILETWWLSYIKGLLLRIQRYRHGGAILITPDGEADLDVKYKISYKRLGTALLNMSIQAMSRAHVKKDIDDNFISQGLAVPPDLYTKAEELGEKVRASMSELIGVSWLVSLLTRVDGLVLMTPTLEIAGFGVVIKLAETAVEVALSSTVTPNVLTKPMNVQDLGTRHRSMMRYCMAHPGAVGLVVSQDGDVRVMTKVDARVIVWDNVLLMTSHEKMTRVSDAFDHLN